MFFYSNRSNIRFNSNRNCDKYILVCVLKHKKVNVKCKKIEATPLSTDIHHHCQGGGIH